VIACGLPHIGRGDHELALKEMAALQNKVAGFRRFGAASLDLAFVAAGRLDGYWERNLQPWDIAAGQIMVREAGGHGHLVSTRDQMGSELPYDVWVKTTPGADYAQVLEAEENMFRTVLRTTVAPTMIAACRYKFPNCNCNV
jgi:fructose-1,6-bisphosphatase/inositol monophosphatase family enzyme